jgi:hypothetical protein
MESNNAVLLGGELFAPAVDEKALAHAGGAVEQAAGAHVNQLLEVSPWR